MGKEVGLYYCIILCYIKIMNAKPSANVVAPILNETRTQYFFSLNNTQNFNNTPILRYGHQYTRDCKDFNAAYSCIMTCLENGYEVAKADEKCLCTCSEANEKDNYMPHNVKKGWTIPTTTVPIWATVKTNKKTKLVGHQEDTEEQENIEGSGHGHKLNESGEMESSEEVTKSEEDITTENSSDEKKVDVDKDKVIEENKSVEVDKSAEGEDKDSSASAGEENHSETTGEDTSTMAEEEDHFAAAEEEDHTAAEEERASEKEEGPHAEAEEEHEPTAKGEDHEQASEEEEERHKEAADQHEPAAEEENEPPSAEEQEP